LTLSLRQSAHAAAACRRSLPGDYGFDPLSLGADAEALKWNQQAELIHGRWAMLGAAGCLVPEVLTQAGVADLPIWSEAGKAEYFSDAVTLFLVQGILMNWVELLRWQDIKAPGSVNADPIHKMAGFGGPYALTSSEVGYPGSRFFNPLGMAASPENKLKEIKNGRLAMVAMAGFFTQAFVTHDGPYANLLAHISDPGHVNFFSN